VFHAPSRPTAHPVRLRRRRQRFGFGIAALLGAAILGAVLVAPASAQTPEPTPTPTPTSDFSNTYTLGGVIRNEDTPLEGVGVLVEGPDGFSEVGVTGADGRWAVQLPGRGEYTATLQVETLPEGIAPRDPNNITRVLSIGTTNTVNVLFPTGEGTVVTTTIWDTIATRLVYGLNFGLLLALAAIGISLIFGTTGVNNFAHGEMLTFGALMFYLFTTTLGVNLFLAAGATIALGAAFGFVQDAGLFKPLRRKGVGLVQVLIVTIGLSIALRYTYLFFFGGGTENLRTGITDNVTIGPATLSLPSIVGMVISIVMLVLVGLFLTRTRIGKATRAVSDNAALAATSGINVDRVIRIVWVLAGALTALSGVLYGLYRGVTWDMGFQILLALFAAVTLGGLGSAFGALVGALIIGIMTELSTVWVPPDLRYAVALIVLILVLLVRPQGVLGRRERIG
jgi:neutral amino acid transport system permease protein